MSAQLAFGTVQLGLEYGAANTAGLPSEAQAITLLREAVSSGIRLLDTARAYGLSEERIGRAELPESVTITTKLPGNINSPEEAEASVQASIAALRRPALDVLMLHDWRHRRQHALWNVLLAMKKQGLIKRLGASVQSAQEIATAFRDPAITFVQLPCNLLDWRWQAAGLPALAGERPDIHIQARSALLQGLLASEPDRWPVVREVSAASLCTKLESLAQKLGRKNRADLCYAWLRGLPWLHSIVVGMETSAQLEENLALFQSSPLSENERATTSATLPRAPEQLLNPALWPEK